MTYLVKVCYELLLMNSRNKIGPISLPWEPNKILGALLTLKNCNKGFTQFIRKQ